MKKLLAIMMALVMCFTLVVSASAAKTYSGDNFDIKIDVDGEWEDYGDGYYAFTTDDGTCLEIVVYTEDLLASEGITVDEAYDEFVAAAYEAAADLEEDEIGEFAEGTIAGYDALILEELYDDYAAAMVFICADTCIFHIGLEGNGDDEVYNSLAESIFDITIVEDAGSNVVVDDDEEIVDDDMDEEIVDDEEEIVEDDEDDEKKPSKNDKNDKDDKDDKKDKDDKSDKEDKEDKDEDEKKGDNTTLIIIVAAVAVVAVAAVVIVLVTKKKK